MRKLLPLAVIAASVILQSCSSSGEAAKSAQPPPAKVDNRVKENELTRITLTAEAAKRLGIQTVEAVDADTAAYTSIAAEVMTIPGRALLVNAPVAGSLAAVNRTLTAGQTVRKGEPVFRLTPLTGVQRDMKVTLQADVEATKARLENATQQLARARQLLRDLAGSQRQVDDAEQEFGLAKAAYDASVERLRRLATHPLEADVAMTITAPGSGVIRQLLATPGQTVSSGASLFEVVDFSRVWLRVPVFAGDLNAISAHTEVSVRDVSGAGPSWRATRVAAPPTADPLAVTADLYFEIDNAAGQLRPGSE